ncbi:HD domain-containing protein, partial [bacterium]
YKPVISDAERQALSIRRGSLTPEEYREVQKHAALSFDFLEQIPWTDSLSNIPEIARAHHEKLNGKGYPRGLMQDEIPLQARMMTIADIYDALTAADRPYKKAMPVDKALHILRSEAKDGALDVDLLEIFIEQEVYLETDNWTYTSPTGVEPVSGLQALAT